MENIKQKIFQESFGTTNYKNDGYNLAYWNIGRIVEPLTKDGYNLFSYKVSFPDNNSVETNYISAISLGNSTGTYKRNDVVLIIRANKYFYILGKIDFPEKGDNEMKSYVNFKPKTTMPGDWFVKTQYGYFKICHDNGDLLFLGNTQTDICKFYYDVQHGHFEQYLSNGFRTENKFGYFKFENVYFNKLNENREYGVFELAGRSWFDDNEFKLKEALLGEKRKHYWLRIGGMDGVEPNENLDETETLDQAYTGKPVLDFQFFQDDDSRIKTLRIQVDRDNGELYVDGEAGWTVRFKDNVDIIVEEGSFNVKSYDEDNDSYNEFIVHENGIDTVMSSSEAKVRLNGSKKVLYVDEGVTFPIADLSLVKISESVRVGE